MEVNKSVINKIYIDEITYGLLQALLPPSHPFYTTQKHFFTIKLIYNARQIILPLSEEDKQEKGRIYPARGHIILNKTRYFYQQIRKFE